MSHRRMEETAGCGSPDKVSSHIGPPATELAPFFYFFILSFFRSRCCRAYPLRPPAASQSAEAAAQRLNCFGVTKGRRQTVKVFRPLSASLRRSTITLMDCPPSPPTPSCGSDGQSLPGEYSCLCFAQRIANISWPKTSPRFSWSKIHIHFSQELTLSLGAKAERATATPRTDKLMKVNLFFLTRRTIFVL